MAAGRSGSCAVAARGARAWWLALAGAEDAHRHADRDSIPSSPTPSQRPAGPRPRPRPRPPTETPTETADRDARPPSPRRPPSRSTPPPTSGATAQADGDARSRRQLGDYETEHAVEPSSTRPTQEPDLVGRRTPPSGTPSRTADTGTVQPSTATPEQRRRIEGDQDDAGRADPDRRPLRARRAARPRRHGRGAQGHRPAAGPHGRGQAAAHRPGQRRDVPGPVPPRGAVGGLAEPPGHRRRSTTPARRWPPTARASPSPTSSWSTSTAAPCATSLREGRKMLPERALEITSGVLSALDYSHRAGIIHRDIKPGNVMLTPTGDVKVMDFGIARAIADASSTMTQTSAVVGTAQYLSPEQARGETVDSRSRRLLHRLPALRAAHRPAAVRRRQPGRGGLPARARAGRAADRPRRPSSPPRSTPS